VTRGIEGFGAAELLGWSPDTLDLVERFRGWTETAIERLELAWLVSERRVAIPIRDQAGDELGELRYDPTGEHDPKMLSPTGVGRQLFPPPELIADHELDPERTVWLVEGEPDAIRLWTLGLPAVGVPGAQNWRDEWAGRFTGRHWRVAVCFDCDQAGRDGARRAAAAIVRAGGDARLVDLDPARDDGYDLTDWARLADTAELRSQAARALSTIVDSVQLYRPAADSADSADAEPLELTIQTLEAFAATEEVGARELVGEPGQALIPAGGNVMIYGDGGAGKTTLSVDLAVHLAAGDDWIGIGIAATARTLIVEDEGPRAFFRRKLAGKLDAWQGSPIDDRVLIVERPWARFTFAEERHRVALAAAIDERQLDVVIVGPVVVAGMEKAGTLQDVREFLALVDEVRFRAHREITFVLVHHENKGGEVSGAWEGAGDTLLHLNAQGNGKTRLHIQKARHAPDYHLKTLTLEWADGEGYTIAEKEEVDDDTIEAKILAAIDLDPGVGWTKVAEKVPGVGDKRRRAVRDRLLAESKIVNVRHQAGVAVEVLAFCEEKKTSRLHLVGDPEIKHLLPARRPGEASESDLF
jgi:hypothetical protein